MILKLTPNTHPILHEKIKKCSYNLNRQELSKILIDSMIHHNGVGLSANQIGISERVFVMIRDIEFNEIIVCFNPQIIKTYKEEVEMEEGCLSYPDLYLNISRPKKIIVKYEDVDKKTHKLKLDGLAARVFLHEYDHMQGINFTDLQTYHYGLFPIDIVFNELASLVTGGFASIVCVWFGSVPGGFINLTSAQTAAY